MFLELCKNRKKDYRFKQDSLELLVNYHSRIQLFKEKKSQNIQTSFIFLFQNFIR